MAIHWLLVCCVRVRARVCVCFSSSVGDRQLTLKGLQGPSAFINLQAYEGLCLTSYQGPSMHYSKANVSFEPSLFFLVYLYASFSQRHHDKDAVCAFKITELTNVYICTIFIE